MWHPSPFLYCLFTDSQISPPLKYQLHKQSNGSVNVPKAQTARTTISVHQARRNHLTINIKPVFHQFFLLHLLGFTFILAHFRLSFNLANSQGVHGVVVVSMVMSSISARMGGNRVAFHHQQPI